MSGVFFIFGAGYSGLAIARCLFARFGKTAKIYGTARHAGRAKLLAQAGIVPLLYDGQSFASAKEEAQARAALQTALLCFVSIPPAPLSGDKAAFAAAPGLDFAAAHLGAAQSLIYLSTIGVYGGTQGAWIDETAPLQADTPRLAARREAETAWAQTARSRGGAPLILRLGGIYGGNLAPAGFGGAAGRALSRSPFARILAGQARAIIKPGQVFNRIHAEDLAAAACYLALRGRSGIFNITDGAPCPPQDFLNFAARLAGKAKPPQIDFAAAAAEMSPQARAFYRNNRRVANAKLLASGFRLLYPDYKTGLTKIYQSQNW